jgi:hypothetical protein
MGDMSLEQTFSDGVGANQFNRLYLSERTVSSGANDDIDLNGVLTEALGTVISALEIVGIVLFNRPRDPAGTPNTTNLTFGGGSNVATGGFLGGTTPTVGPIRPGRFFAMMNPDTSGMGAVVAGTGDILRVTNGAGASNTYTIGLLLRNA